MIILQLMSILLLLGFLAITFMWIFNQHNGRGVSKIRMIADALPGDDCGVCGHKNCQSFAQAITTGGENMIEKCRLMSAREVQHVENLLGYQLKNQSSLSAKVATIMCAPAGLGLPKRVDLASINWSCEAVALSVGNDALCYDGCIGLGDCIPWCPVGAIYKDEHAKIAIDMQKCTGCGLCVNRCPKAVIQLVERESLIQVKCSSQADAQTKAVICPNGGCTACNECVKMTGRDAFVIANNLAKRGAGSVREQEIDRILASCPTAVIERLERPMAKAEDSKI